MALTAQQMIEYLSSLDPETEIRSVHQPNWPLEARITGLAQNNPDEPVYLLAYGDGGYPPEFEQVEDTY
ncbi:hypothetical protein [Corynebacterium comes]|uniref:Uncharacterized protein n=1 Tax=Corynebacterium comes TaxID=2675218 RepID=A0A6B8W2E3_9CORY|nr:hypothetical protein [Corynebacterium comes]QGU05096.1 hypothetical protein CETAM_09215 [Corynebacterium comes]